MWEISGSNESGWYMEGHSDKAEGWFCMELESFDDVLTQLKELGFIS